MRISVSLFVDKNVGDEVPGIRNGVLRLDYANGAVGLADCHQSCGHIGTANWNAVQKMQRELAAGLVSVPMTENFAMVRPVADPNTFVMSMHMASPPEG